MASAAPLSSRAARLCVVLAALIWSTSGVFTKILREQTAFHLNVPHVEPLQIAFFRVVFAGAVLLPLLRRRDLSFRPIMLFTAGSFAAMNALFVSAMALGSAANAILLQYTAPMWMYLACVFLLGEPPDRRGGVALVIGLAGIAVIVLGGRETGQASVIAIALGSGVAYAAVMIGLRVLRDVSPRWLTALHFFVSGLVLIPFVWAYPVPTGPQLFVLFLYGAVQMTVPYWLMARALRSISPQEAGTITLLEPLLNPVWSYLVSPATETPSPYTVLGGACILGALAYRYWPFRRPETPLTTGRRSGLLG
jgi:drug/metabolite transporter (DMT)-like permease